MKKLLVFFLSLLGLVSYVYSDETTEDPSESVDSCLTPLEDKIISSSTSSTEEASEGEER